MVLQSMSGISKCVLCYIVWQKIYCNVYKVSPGVSTRIKYGTITSLAKKSRNAKSREKIPQDGSTK